VISYSLLTNNHDFVDRNKRTFNDFIYTANNEEMQLPLLLNLLLNIIDKDFNKEIQDVAHPGSGRHGATVVQQCRNYLKSKTDFLNWKSVFCYLSSLFLCLLWKVFSFYLPE